MPIIGNPIYQSAFVVDQFSGNGSTVAFTMSVAPAGVTNVLVAVSGVLQDPSTYGVVGNTITFSAAPPTGTGNISCRYLGVPVTGVTTTAYRTVTEFTATASQTTFTPPSYTVGFINVYLNGVLLGSADYTATNGTTVVLATGASAGNLVTVESFLVSSVLNAIPNTAGSVSSSNIQTSPTLTTPTINKINDASGGSIAPISSVMRNRIINGACVIDQRNNGASITQDTSGTQYSLDRWSDYGNVSSKFTIQQNAGSVTPPTGFTNYLGVTSSSAYAVGSSDIFTIQQRLEGYNVADLAFGTANAKTITVSFWVRSSLTGTFGGAINNIDATRSYPFTYTISAANTWTQISITVAGDTSGTWNTTNNVGLRVTFGLGVGATYSGTAGAWATASYFSATSAVSVVGTSGATWFITGLQLEVGTQATGFEYRQYTTELALCQRYYEQSYPVGTVAGTAYVSGSLWFHVTSTITGYLYGMIPFKVTKRAIPTMTFWSYAGTIGTASNGNVTDQGACGINGQSNTQYAAVGNSSGSTQTPAGSNITVHYTASAEL